jgi:hypothetical protein
MNRADLFHRAEAVPGVTTVGFVLVILTLVGFLGIKPLTRSVWRALASVVLLLGCTLTWWLVNGPLEGRTFVTVTPTHGFTLGDTLGLPALAVSATLLLVAIRKRKPPRDGHRAGLPLTQRS